MPEEGQRALIDDVEGSAKTTEEIAAEEAAAAATLAEEEAAKLALENADADVDLEEKDIDGVMYKINKGGDALDDSGEVKFTKTQIEEMESVESIIINETEFTLDKDGHAVDKDGEIIHTAEDIAKMNEESEGVPTVTASGLIEKTNINILDTAGNPVEYGDDEEGAIKYTNDVHELGLKTGAQDYEKEMFDALPILRQIIPHLVSNNGTLEGFTDTVDYSTLKIDKDNLSQMKNFIFTARLKRGENEESIDKYYDYLIKASDDNDEVFKEAATSLKFLVDGQKSDTAAKQKMIDDAEVANVDSAKEFWGVEITDDGKLKNLNVKGSVKQVIDDGKLTVGNDTYTIPSKINVKVGDKVVHKTKDDFFDYLFAPKVYVVDGRKVQMTGDAYAIHQEELNLTKDDNILSALRRFTGYNDSQIIKDKVEAAKVKTVRRLTTSKKRGGSASRITDEELILSPKR